MLFLPPVVPPLSLGRFKKHERREISARCTTPNHRHVGITDSTGRSSSRLGLPWSYDEQSVTVWWPWRLCRTGLLPPAAATLRPPRWKFDDLMRCPTCQALLFLCSFEFPMKSLPEPSLRIQTGDHISTSGAA